MLPPGIDAEARKNIAMREIKTRRDEEKRRQSRLVDNNQNWQTIQGSTDSIIKYPREGSVPWWMWLIIVGMIFWFGILVFDGESGPPPTTASVVNSLSKPARTFSENQVAKVFRKQLTPAQVKAAFGPPMKVLRDGDNMVYKYYNLVFSMDTGQTNEGLNVFFYKGIANRYVILY